MLGTELPPGVTKTLWSEIEVGAAPHWECTKCLWIVHFKISSEFSSYGIKTTGGASVGGPSSSTSPVEGCLSQLISESPVSAPELLPPARPPAPCQAGPPGSREGQSCTKQWLVAGQ